MAGDILLDGSCIDELPIEQRLHQVHHCVVSEDSFMIFLLISALQLLFEKEIEES